MTTHELARKLLEGPDLPVLLPGYEGGLGSVDGVAEMTVHLDVEYNDYYGAHVECDESADCYWCGEGKTPVKTVVVR